MFADRRLLVLAVGIVTAAVVATQLPAMGHTAKIASRVTLTSGYGFFRGKVGSPMPACRANRTVKLFKDVAGTDPLLKSTQTNSTGEWAIFRSYEVATFYVKAPTLTIRRRGHTHTCKATTSLLRAAPTRVTPGDLDGWSVTQYDCLVYAGDPAGAPPLEGQPFVAGPGTPPAGFGSLKLINTAAAFGFSFTFTRWDGLDGQPLSRLNSISFSTFMDDNTEPIAPPPTLSLHIDVTGDGGATEEISFTPPDPAVVADRWQRWTAGQSTTWDTPGGPMTLSEYRTAHPSAEFEDSPHGLQFQSDCQDAGNVPHYMDAVIVRLTGETQGFDFEP
jgi:hypothetical protein